MSDLRSLVIKNGTTQNISNADTLIVGTKVDAASGQALSVGDVNATGITIGSALITTNFPGPVTLTGDVTTVGGTTFTTDATFEGNVTFGAGAADTVTFAALTTITSDIAMGGGSPTYKVTNLANGTNPNDAVNFSQLSAIVSGVSAVTATSPVLSSGGSTPVISISTAGASAGDVLTYNGAAWAAAAPAVTATAQGGANAVQYANSATPANFDGDNTKLAFNESTSQLSVGTGTANETLTVNGRVAIAETTVPTNTAGYGKLWADTAAKTLHFYDNSIDYLVTPNTVATLVVTPVVLPSTFDTTTLDFAPNLPPIKTVALTTTGGRSGNLEFATSNLLASRNISVRVEGDTVSRNLLFPAWTWLGGTTPTVLPANQTAILSLAAFGGADTDVVASWSVDANTVVTSVTASLPLASSGGTTPNLSITAGTASGELLTWNGSAWVAAAPATGGTVTSVTLAASTTGLTISGAASQTITSSGTFTLGGTLAVGNGGTGTSTAFTAGSVVFAGASGVYAQDNANLFWDNGNERLGIGIAVPTASLHVAGNVLAKNATNSTTAFQVQDAAGTVILDVDTTNVRVGIGAVPATHSFEIYNAFAVAAGGRIHTYDGSAPTDGQVLIGTTAGGNFAKAAITAGAGISVTNGAGSITIAATGSAIDMDTSGVAVADACYVSASGVVSRASAFAPTAPKYRQARVVGIASTSAVAGKVLMSGKATATFVSGLTLVAGDPIYLSLTSGLLTNDVSAITASGDAIAEVGMLTSSLSYGSALDSGTATSGGASTLTDTAKTWTVNVYAGKVVTITGGTGSGQVRKIASNTVNTLTVGVAWTLPGVDNTSTYAISDGDAQIAVQPKTIVVL